MFLQDWGDVVRTFVVGALAYLGLLVLLRISGKRTLSSMNAFDLIVSVALGSTLATILLSEDVALLEGLAAFATLIGLQFAITWLSVHTKVVPRLVKSEPTLLAYQGALLAAALQGQRVAPEEVRQAIRQAGHASVDDVHAVVLETDGSFSIVERAPADGEGALRGIR